MTPPNLPPLTILNPNPLPERRGASEKYGALFYLGIAGLALIVGLIGWFAIRVWQMRDAWTAIAVLHDGRRSDLDRINAALALSRDSRLNQRQLWDICLRRDLPAPARYLIAEALTGEAALSDPEAYVLAVAYSEGWPVWLRLLLVRPLAYAADSGLHVSAEPLRTLSRHDDPAIALFAQYIRAVALDDDQAAQSLSQAAQQPNTLPELAALLDEARNAEGEIRRAKLDQATAWLRDNHPQAASLWNGLRERDGWIVAVPVVPTSPPSAETP
jgi:hypothetical protein